ncbi:zinc ribbon domain-containing protein [Streptomyces sp. NPDC002545]
MTAELLPPSGAVVGIDMGTVHFLATSDGAHAANPMFLDAFLPNGAAAKAGRSRGILDASWGQLLTLLANKAESAGRLAIGVDARNTSRTCPARGHVAKENRVTQAKFQCTACGFTADADRVGATNVLNRAGLVLCDVASPPSQGARAFTRGWSHDRTVSEAPVYATRPGGHRYISTDVYTR